MATTLTQIGDGAKRLFRWWISELASLVPKRIAQRFSSRGNGIVVDVARSNWAIYRDDKDDSEPLIRIPADELPTDAARGGVRQRLRALGLQGRNVALKVKSDQILVRSIGLPAAASGNLRQAIALQIERKTPFASDDVFFDYKVLGRDADSRQIRVKVVLVPRSLADDLVHRSASFGLHATAIVSEGGENANWISLPDGSLRRNRTRRRLNLGLAVVATLLLVAVVYIPLEQRREAVERLEIEMGTLKTKADEVLRLRESIDRRYTAIAFLQDRKRETASAVAVIAWLTELLPDDTWLLQFNMSDHTVRVSGYAPNASALVGLIDGADRFASPRFVSPVTPVAGGNSERFDMSFIVEGGE